jgi:hypothetical protein
MLAWCVIKLVSADRIFSKHILTFYHYREIVDMDNRYPIVLNGEEKKSSDIIVNKLGGLQAIADGLKTNMKVSFNVPRYSYAIIFHMWN